MSINRSGDTRPQQVFRLSPIDRGDNEDDRGDKHKRKVQYRGRSWHEDDEELPVQPSAPLAQKSQRSVYADQSLVARAELFLSRFVTLEEKAAQLVFYSTEAFYDKEVQEHLELVIQKYHVGGIAFTKGEYRRQAYLIERYQTVSRTPLLFGNDFKQGLSFYFQTEISMQTLEKMDERKCSDLGKAVAIQNKKLGVHFQFDSASDPHFHLGEREARSFRNGIREALGIVAREKKGPKMQMATFESAQNPLVSLVTRSENVQEAYGLRTAHFLTVGPEDTQEKILEALFGGVDALLVTEKVEETIATIANAVKRGKILESDLDRKVIKILLLKKF